MSEEDEPQLSVDEFVDYCRTQARLLSGSVQTMGEAADDLLDEIDEEVAEIRARLEEGDGSVERTDAPASTGGPDGSEVDVAAIEARESSLETKQARVEAKQARMEAYRELADGYTALAEELGSAVDDGRAAMTRVVEFEAENDAPAYFEDRLTVVEAAGAATGSRTE